MGLLDFEKLQSDPLFQMGLGILSNNKGHYGKAGPAIAGGVMQGMAEFERLKKDRERKEQWKKIMQAGMINNPEIPEQFKVGDQVFKNQQEANDFAQNEFIKANTGGSSTVTGPMAGKYFGDMTQQPNYFGMPEQTPDMPMDGDTPLLGTINVTAPKYQEMPQVETVPGKAGYSGFDPYKSMQAAMQSDNPEMAFTALQGLGAYGKAHEQMLENKALQDVQEVLKNTQGDPQKAIQALLSVGNYKGASMLANAMKNAGGEPTAFMRDWNYYTSQTPAEQERMLQFKRANQVLDLGNESLVIAPNARPIGRYEKGIPPAQTPSNRAAVTTAEKQAAIATERAAEAPKAGAKMASMEAQNAKLDNAIKRAEELAGTFTTGFLGNITQKIPGTQGYDLAATVQTIKANLGFNELQNMRDNSPTGGALGQVAVQELQALQSAVANLEQSQSKEQFLANLNIVREQNRISLERARAMLNQTYGTSSPTGSVRPKRTYNPKTGRIE